MSDNGEYYEGPYDGNGGNYYAGQDDADGYYDEDDEEEVPCNLEHQREIEARLEEQQENEQSEEPVMNRLEALDEHVDVLFNTVNDLREEAIEEDNKLDSRIDCIWEAIANIRYEMYQIQAVILKHHRKTSVKQERFFKERY